MMYTTLNSLEKGRGTNNPPSKTAKKVPWPPDKDAPTDLHPTQPPNLSYGNKSELAVSVKCLICHLCVSMRAVIPPFNFSHI